MAYQYKKLVGRFMAIFLGSLIILYGFILRPAIELATVVVDQKVEANSLMDVVWEFLNSQQDSRHLAESSNESPETENGPEEENSENIDPKFHEINKAEQALYFSLLAKNVSHHFLTRFIIFQKVPTPPPEFNHAIVVS